MSDRMLCFTSAACEIQAAEGDAAKLPRFRMTAYTGGPMRVGWWDAPVVVDLAGMAIPSQRRPMRLQHDPGEGVGHTEKIEVRDGALFAEGVISRSTPAAKDVAESGRNGFPWQASIGVTIEKYEFVKGGQQAIVNGRAFAGPLYVMRRTVLAEISFVDLGADPGTTAVVACLPAPQTREETPMPPIETPAATVPPVTAVSLETPPATTAPPAVPPAPPAQPVPPVTAAAPAPVVPVQEAVAGLRAGVATETERIAAVRTLCAGKPEIEARAIRDGWTVERTELEVLRASRPQAPAVHTPSAPQTTTQLLQCAVELSCPLAGTEKRFEPPVVEAAGKRWHGGIGLFELLLEAAYANGYRGTGSRDRASVMRFAFRPDLCGGFSAVDIGGILSATANKMLLEGFTAVERTWRNVCAVRAVKDFKTVLSYRLTGTEQYQRVTPAGEIHHGDLAEESFSNRADTYGLMLAITRQDIINDDLGAISTVPRKLGRGAALKLNDVFWSTFLGNAAFFALAKGNYSEGAATALGVDALSTIEAAFLNMVDPDGHPLGVNPALVLVPPALSAIAQQLYKGAELRDTTSSKQYIVMNPHAGKYRVEVSRYLSNVAYTGNSAKAWYLLADPQDVPVIEVAFLNGQEAPTVETADADFNTLGIQMRGYHDFGVALQDCRGGHKAKGEA